MGGEEAEGSTFEEEVGFFSVVVELGRSPPRSPKRERKEKRKKRRKRERRGEEERVRIFILETPGEPRKY